MDGLQATRQIRKWEKEQMQTTRPRAHSAGNSPEDLQPLLESRTHSSARTYAQTYTIRPRNTTNPPVRVQPLRIIALTADVMPGVSEECDAAGMDGFLTKPLDYRNLLRVVQEVCEKANAQEAANA
jgi:CheY-like chemotaxis protein